MEHTTQNVLDKQVRKVYAMKHSMFASNRLLFQSDMKDRLQSPPESKRLWLESITTAVHNFLVVHKRTPSQRAIIEFFPTVTPNNTDTKCNINSKKFKIVL
eukprot:15153759-Ditylum_brightwellii.AAC.1